MKNFTKAAVLAAVAALGVQAAHAQTPAIGDLVVGFTGNAKSPATDYIIDLGQFSSFSTTAITHLGSSIDLNNFNSLFNSINGTSVGAVAGKGLGGTGDYITVTQTRTGNNALGLQGTDTTPTKPASRSFVTTAGGDVTSLVLGNTLASSQQSFAVQSQGTTGGTIANDSTVNFLTTISGSTAVMDIFTSTRGATATTAYAYQGQLDLDLSGSSPVLDFVPAGFVAVPEPTTYGILAGAGLLALALRRQFRLAA